MHDTIDDLINSIYHRTDISEYINLILRRYHYLSIYLIEPYFPQKEGAESLSIPVTENYTIHDHGGYIEVAPNDIYSTPLFACSEFLLAVEKAIVMLLSVSAQEIAILGDYRAKLFVWDSVEKLNLLENNPLKLINFGPPESFGLTRDAIMRYLKDHGMEPKVPRSGIGAAPAA